MDLPLFGDHPTKRRREINLGGLTSTATHTSLLQDARARRLQRNDQRRRVESATRIQSWWRGRVHARRVRRELCDTFDREIRTLTGARCLALAGAREEGMLGRWAAAMLEDDARKCSL
jgi:ubiquitin-protein ligase E3 C